MKNLVYVLCVLLFASACTKTPQSCITADKTVVSIGENISFSSCAIDAKRTSWNFGDGSVSEEGSVQHAYQLPGIYQVQLRVYSNKDKKWDTSTLIINVKEKIRYLKRIQLNSFNINNPNSQPWDANMNTAPDIFIQFGIVGSAIQSQTSTIGELQLNQCPIFWDFSSGGYPLLTNENWKFTISDNDGTILQPLNELMNEFVVNPFTAPSNNNKISLISGNYSLELEFVE